MGSHRNLLDLIVQRTRLWTAGSHIFATAFTLAFVLPGTASSDPETAATKSRQHRDTDSQADMKPYVQSVAGTDLTIDFQSISGGTFVMGSHPDEADRNDDEGPAHSVTLSPFWMAKYETTWELYDCYRLAEDLGGQPDKSQSWSHSYVHVDGITRPSSEFVDQTFGMGHDGFPAINMTQLAAKTFCEWLSRKTGRYYRLPTEAEWEYACRAGTKTAYSWGDNPAAARDHACFYNNDDPVNSGYIKVGTKKPNPWGLHDMHGNVAEWCLDQYVGEFYGTADSRNADPIAVPKTLYPRVIRGGSYDHDIEDLRSAARGHSTSALKIQDPQLPRSKWYHTDAYFVGFRVIRPLHRPSDLAIAQKRLGPDHFIDTELERLSVPDPKYQQRTQPTIETLPAR